MIAIGLAAALIAALFQAKPGRGDWLTSLAGDWSIALCNDYVISPSGTQSDGNYQLLRWGHRGEKYANALRSVADGVKAYSVFGDEVLLKSSSEWIVINTLTDEQAIYSDTNLPNRFERYRQDMVVPRQSQRDRLILLSFVLAGILAYRLLKGYRQSGRSFQLR